MVTLTIDGQRVMLLNGGPHYTLSPAFSFMLSVADQVELDRLWDALLDGGEPSRCGWLTDRFGVSWQVVPEQLGALMSGPDPAAAARVSAAMMAMDQAGHRSAGGRRGRLICWRARTAHPRPISCSTALGVA